MMNLYYILSLNLTPVNGGNRRSVQPYTISSEFDY